MKAIKEKSFKINYVGPENEKEAAEMRKPIAEIKAEEKDFKKYEWEIINPKKKKSEQ